MRTIVKKINVYKFNELNKESQDKVISDYIDFVVDTTDFYDISKNSNLYKAFKKANEMRTPWFLGSYIWQLCEKQILKEVNKCEYLGNGEIFVD